jgi:hypothetical protein
MTNPTATTPACEGSPLNISTLVTPLTSTVTWTFPDNTTATGASLNFASATLSQTGTYGATATLNGCEALVRRASNYKKILDASKAVAQVNNNKKNPNSITHPSTTTTNNNVSSVPIENRVITTIGDGEDCGCGGSLEGTDSETHLTHHISHFAPPTAPASIVESLSNTAVVEEEEGEDDMQIDENDHEDDEEDDEDDSINDDDDDEEADMYMDEAYDPEVMHEQSQLEELALTHSHPSTDTEKVDTTSNEKEEEIEVKRAVKTN